LTKLDCVSDTTIMKKGLLFSLNYLSDFFLVGFIERGEASGSSLEKQLSEAARHICSWRRRRHPEKLSSPVLPPTAPSFQAASFCPSSSRESEIARRKGGGVLSDKPPGFDSYSSRTDRKTCRVAMQASQRVGTEIKWGPLGKASTYIFVF
jgi:hypothetical protein